MHGAWCRLSDLTDLKFFKENLNGTLFPDVPDAVEVHNGFGSEHAKTAATILAETQKLIAANGATQVLVVRPISLSAPLLSPRAGGLSLSGARPPLSYSEGLRARLPGGAAASALQKAESSPARRLLFARRSDTLWAGRWRNSTRSS